MLTGEPLRATPLHFVPSAEEVPRTIIDIAIDGFVGRGKAAIGEVRGPADQKAVQPRSHFRPGALVARRQQRADLRLDPQHALLGWARAQIPAPSVGMMTWSQPVAKEVEALASGILHRGFRLVERQPEFRHYRLRPRQRLLRVSAAEDDEVVGIGDDVRMERFAASRRTPMLQE